MKSASCAGPSIACSAATISAGTCGSSCRISSARCLSARARPSISESTALGLVDVLHARDRERIALEELQHAKAPHALGDRVVRAVGRGDVAQHGGAGADPVQVVGRRARRPRACSAAARRAAARRRTASCTAARERSRPTVSGNTMPGNSTTLRTGRMISASSGSGRDAPCGRGAGACRPHRSRAAPSGGQRAGDPDSGCRSSASSSADLAQPQDQAALRPAPGVPSSSAPAAARCAARRRHRESRAGARAWREPVERQRPHAAHDQRAGLVRDLHALGGHARAWRRR